MSLTLVSWGYWVPFLLAGWAVPSNLCSFVILIDKRGYQDGCRHNMEAKKSS